MKICLVAEYYPPHIGGGEIFIQKIAEGLVKKGDECLVITTRTERYLPSVEINGNLKVVRIFAPKFARRFWFSLYAIIKTVSLAKDCHLIHGASYGGAIPAFLAAKILRKKCILMVYEFMGGLWGSLESNWVLAWVYQFSEKIIARLAFDKFVAISCYTRNCLRFLGVPDDRLEFVYGGLNREILAEKVNQSEIKKSLGFSSEDFIYLVYGRAGISKGVQFLVQAIPGIIKKVPTAKFVLILTKSGDKTWNQIMNRLDKLPGTIYKLLLGMPMEELSNYLAIADCVVVPSLSEGFGLTTLEACALRKRVVATNVGSIPEVIFGEHVLVKPASFEALIEGCNRAYIGDMDFSHPKTFDWERTVDQCKKIYNELLGR